MKYFAKSKPAKGIFLAFLLLSLLLSNIGQALAVSGESVETPNSISSGETGDSSVASESVSNPAVEEESKTTVTPTSVAEESIATPTTLAESSESGSATSTVQIAEPGDATGAEAGTETSVATSSQNPVPLESKSATKPLAFARSMMAPMSTSVSLKFIGNGGTFEDGLTEVTLIYDTSTVLNSPLIQYPGYILTAWNDGTQDIPITDFYGYQVSADTTFTAVWTEEVFITFDASPGFFDLGTSYGSQSQIHVYPKGSSVFLPRVQQVGYIHKAWVSDGVSYEPLTEIPAADSDMTFTAVWVEGVDITYDAGDYVFDAGEPWESKTNVFTFEKDTPIYLPQIIRDGYELKGWEANGMIYSLWGEAPLATSAVTYHAVWVELVDITYDADGGFFNEGTEFEMQVYTEPVEINTRVPSPYVTRSGYIFRGWKLNNVTYTSQDTLPLASTPVTFTADWEKKVAITFDATIGSMPSHYDGSPVSVETLYFEKDTQIYWPNPTANGYVFKGWQVNGITYELWESAPLATGDMTITATWAEAVDITFDGNGGKMYSFDDGWTIATQTLPIEKDSLYYFPTVEYDTYVFLGWESNGELFTIYDNVDTSTTRTYKATWEAGIKLSFDAGAGEFVDGSKTEIRYQRAGEIIGLPAEPILSGKAFAGWNDGTNTYHVNDLYTMPVENEMSFTAVWEDFITLTWNAAGGVYPDGSTQKTQIEVKNMPLGIYLDLPKRPGYRFDTWVIASGANAGTIYRYTALPEDTVLEATWIKQVVVSFDMGPGFTRDSEEFDINKRWVDSLALDTTKYKNGNKVVVGYLTPDGTVYNGEALTQDLHLTAIWEDGLTVTLDANGGTINDANLPNTVLVKPNMPAALPSIDSLFTKDGYVGMDWTFADGTPYNYELITADTTLYAQYAVPVTVIIDGNGGKVLDPKDWTYKDQIIDKIKPNTTIRSLAGERQGYIFGGLLAPDGRIYNYQNIGSDITFKAIWGKAITVSFDMGPDVTRTSEIIAEGSKWVETKYTPGMNGLVVSYYTLPDGTRYTDQILYEDTELTAVWTKNIKVHFSAGDGRWVTTEFMDNLITVPAGTMPYDISGTDFTMYMQKDGMLWAGWNFADGTPADRVPLTEDTTLYARYGEAVEITFIYDGGSALQSSTMRFGKGYVGEISAPLRATDRFMGYRRPDGRYYPASHRFIVFDESMTLTAMWNEITATTEGDVALKFIPYSDGTQAEQIRANLQDSNFEIPLDQVFLYTEHVPGYTPSSEYGTQLPPPPPNTTRNIDSETYDVGFENLDGQKIQPAAGELVEFYVPLGDFDPDSVEVVHVGADGEELVNSQVIGSSVYIKGPGFSYYVIRGAVLTPITPEETTSSTSASENTTTSTATGVETTTTTTTAAAASSTTTKAAETTSSTSASENTTTSTATGVETTTTTTTAAAASSTTTKAAESSSTAATTQSIPRTGERQPWPYALGGLLLVLAGFATILLRKNQRDETKLD